MWTEIISQNLCSISVMYLLFGLSKVIFSLILSIPTPLTHETRIVMVYFTRLL